jgi:hypothetical protein
VRTQLKLYDSLDEGIEVESFINSIPIDDGFGKEVIMRIGSPIVNFYEFYTDANGLEM